MIQITEMSGPSPSKKRGRPHKAAPVPDEESPGVGGEHPQMVVVIDESEGANSNEQAIK